MPMMRVRVDPAKCQGHARCIAAVPEIFEEDEQGHSFARDEQVPADLVDAVRLAEQNCPELAIDVTDD